MRKALYLMGVLEDSDIQWMADNGTKQFVRTGTRLIEEGKPIDSLFIVLDGNLAVETRASRQPIANLKSGEVVGEISFIDQRPPLASVTASQNTHVLTVSRSTLQGKLQRDPQFAGRFYRAIALYLADRLRVTSSRLGYGDAAQDNDVDELDESLMDNASMGALRFDGLLRQLSVTAKATA